MDNPDTERLAAISFADLFGEDNTKLSMERVEAFINRAVELSSTIANITPNQLIRVIHEGKILWMTHQEAKNYLANTDQADLQEDVEKALHGALIYIRQELEILLALANYTFNKFVQDKAISPMEINQFSASLQRRKAELKESVSQTAHCEAILKAKRRENPLLDEYEQLMGEFINAKNHGDMDTAMKLARHLAEKKKYYLLLAHSIEPDIHTIYYHRHNLQKAKKRIINTQGQLCSSRLESLRLEISELQENLESIKNQLKAAEDNGEETASATLKKEDLFSLKTKEKELTNKSSELLSLKTESKILEKQETKIKSIIQQIQENVLQDPQSKPNVVDLKRKQKKVHSLPQQSTTPKSKQSGMHVRNIIKSDKD